MTQGVPFQFRDNFYALATPGLSTGNAEKYLYVCQLMGDLLVEKAYEAQSLRLPGIGDPSNLPYLAFDRQLLQGLAEPNAAFATRLAKALQTWAHAGSSLAVLEQLQAYLQGLQPEVAATLPMLTIVGYGELVPVHNKRLQVWDTLYQGDAIGALPTHVTSHGLVFDWDGNSRPWRRWLVLYMSQVAGPLSGSAAEIAIAAFAGSLYVSGGTATNHTWGQLTTMLVNGIEQQVWVPNTTGTPVNTPFLNVTGLAGLGPAQVGQWLTLSGSTNPTNNGTFPITAVTSPTLCTIANPAGVPSDIGPLTWSIGTYPFLAPAPVWGAPGFTFGQGELQTPPLDLGSNVGGVWRPTLGGPGPALAWGLSMQPTVLSPPPPTASVIATVRQLVRQWKSGGTYYEGLVVAFDGGTGAPGGAYSPYSGEGSGNPDGSFGGHGKLATRTIGGVEVQAWVPNRLITSEYDCYCQGSGSWSACTVTNVT